jgi:hypothetical protein
MTEPDDGLAGALRLALSETPGVVTSGAAGLDAIQARIGGRPPRPWLLSVLAHGAERARYWTWRGHWAWPESLPGLVQLAAAARVPGRGTRGTHRRRSRSPEWGIGGLRLTAVFGAVAVIAGLSFGVQPFRQAIIQASATMLNGVSGQKPGGAGTDGNGSQAAGGLPPTAGALHGQGGGAGAAPGQAGHGAAGQPGSSCVSPAATSAANTQLDPTAAASGTAPAAPDTASPTATPTPAATSTAEAGQSGQVPVACSAGTPTSQASDSSSAAAPSDSAADDTPSDTQTDSWPTDTPTDYSTTDTSPSPTPTDSDGYTPPAYPSSPPYASDPPATSSPPPPWDWDPGPPRHGGHH